MSRFGSWAALLALPVLLTVAASPVGGRIWENTATNPSNGTGWTGWKAMP